MAMRQWIRADGDKTLRLNYPLSKDSVVFDIGGYKGDWAENIYNQYGCNIFIFEPVEGFYNEIVTKFQGVESIKAYNYGLAGSDQEMNITVQNDASSTIACSGIEKELIQLKDVSTFCEDQKIDEIDLIKINIEGGEFELLERMFEQGLVAKCKNIQIQFHDFFPEAKSLRQDIRERLKETHHLTYDYYFVWENWERI